MEMARLANWLKRPMIVMACVTGMASAQTGTITFHGAITDPSCDFEPTAEGLAASCKTGSGKTITTPVRLARGSMPRHTRIGLAELDVEPLFRNGGSEHRSSPTAYVLVITYQ